MALITQIYKPAMTVGQVYARVRGSAAAMRPVGNVSLLELTHTEDVKKMPDMTRTGGGNYAQVRRVTDCTLKLKLMDWNPVNFTRAVFGTVATVAGATVTDESHTAYKGGLVRLHAPGPTTATVKIGATPVTAAGNFEVRKEGIYVFEDATDIDDADTLLVSYTHPEYVDVQALTSAAQELELSFGGLNEADSGKPIILDIWRLSSGVAKTLALVQTTFGELEVEGEVLADQTKTGEGVSKFYQTHMA